MELVNLTMIAPELAPIAPVRPLATAPEDPTRAWNLYLAALTPIERRAAIKGRRSMRAYRHHACYWPRPRTYPRAK
jgi:hypothetical protein